MVRLVGAMLAVAIVASCKKREAAPANDVAKTGSNTAGLHEVTGTLVVDGKSLGPLTCQVGRGVTTYVEAVTPAGKLRFEDRTLFWSGQPLDCEKLDRSWGGGLRADGTSYFRGTLAFACTGKKTVVSGDLRFDCGHITDEERAQLDKNRADMKAEQRAQGSSGSAAMASRSRCNDLFRHLVDLELAKAKPPDPAEAERQRAAILEAKSAEFIETCTTKTSAARVACALAARDLDAVERCDATP